MKFSFFHLMPYMGGPRTAGRLVPQKTRYYQDQANAGRMQQRLAKREAATLEEQIAGGMVFCGSPESVVRQMRRVHGELGNGDRVLPEVRDL